MGSYRTVPSHSATMTEWWKAARVPDRACLTGWRWVVERTFAWLNQFRRLRVRDEKRADIHQAFLSLACALICLACPVDDLGDRVAAAGSLSRFSAPHRPTTISGTG